MKSIKEICELIEKNQAKELKLEYEGRFVVKYINIMLEGDENRKIQLQLASGNNRPEDFQALTNQLENFKKSVLQNISIERVILQKFSGESFKHVVGMKVPGMQSLSLVGCNGTLDNIRYLTDLLSTPHLVSFEYLLSEAFCSIAPDTKMPSFEVFDSYLTKALKIKKNLRKIKLAFCIDESNVNGVSNMISNLKNITSLDLATDSWYLGQCLIRVPQTCVEVSFGFGLLSNYIKGEMKEIVYLLLTQNIQKLTLKNINIEVKDWFEKIVSLLNHKTLTSLNFEGFGKFDPKIKKEFLETLSKNNTLKEVYVNKKRFSKEMFYRQCSAVKLLMQKRLAKGPIQNILSFICDDASMNELAYSTYSKCFVALKKAREEQSSQSILSRKLKAENNLNGIKMAFKISWENVKSISNVISTLKGLTGLELAADNSSYLVQCLAVAPQTVSEIALNFGLVSNYPEEERVLERDIVQIVDLLLKRNIQTLILKSFIRESKAFEKFVPLLKHETLTSLNLYGFAEFDAKSKEEFLNTLSKNNTLEEVYFNGIRFSKEMFHRQCFAVKLLIQKRVAKGPIQNILSFICSDTSLNEAAYSTYSKCSVALKKTEEELSKQSTLVANVTSDNLVSKMLKLTEIAKTLGTANKNPSDRQSLSKKRSFK